VFEIGDAVRVRVTPDVDSSLWDDEGVVLAFTSDEIPVVELSDGTNMPFDPEQLDLVEPAEAKGPDAMFGPPF
jgi:hypothetical protein